MGKFKKNEIQGGNGETFRYENKKGLYFVKRGVAETIDSINVQSEYLLSEVLNLLGIKTPTELLLAKTKGENADYILIKRAVADQENNKKIPENKGEEKKADPNRSIDIKWTVRNLAVKLLLNCHDIYINQLKNTFPIVYNKKNGTKFQKFIHHDPVLITQNLNIEVQNFFKFLKSDIDFSHYKNIKSYFQDVETNENKQVEIVGYLQKILYNIKENKAMIFELIEASTNHFNQQTQFTDKYQNHFKEQGEILRDRINHAEKIITELTKKFSKNYTIPLYNPRLAKTESHIAHKVLPDLGEEDLEEIGKPLKHEKPLKQEKPLEIVRHFNAKDIREKIALKKMQEKPSQPIKILRERSNVSNTLINNKNLIIQTSVTHLPNSVQKSKGNSKDSFLPKIKK